MVIPRPSLATILSLNAGFVDTAGFLALQGLFTAHVTGNFVTLGASAVFGLSGAFAKLLALPVFCGIIVLTRLWSSRLAARGVPVLRTLLGLKLVLLVLAAALAVAFGPFVDGDAPATVATGMVLVAAMAIQNAGHRVHLPKSPPTTLMTGTTTQIMLDVADILHGSEFRTPVVVARAKGMAVALAAFALGCAMGAIFYALADVWCFLLPPLVAAFALASQIASGEGDVATVPA